MTDLIFSVSNLFCDEIFFCVAQERFDKINETKQIDKVIFFSLCLQTPLIDDIHSHPIVSHNMRWFFKISGV